MSVAHISTPREGLHSEMLTVNEETREVHLVGELIEFTRTEFDLLSILYRNPRRVLTPEVLLSAIWDSD
jgi:DNA-binding response OmpR family regulator